MNQFCLFYIYISASIFLFDLSFSIPRADSAIINRYLKLSPSPPNFLHQLIFSVKQNSIDTLDSILQDRSDPHSIHYQKWLNFEQVNDIVANLDATTAIKVWLKSAGVKVTQTTSNGEFIEALAPIHLWETLLQAKFHMWTERNPPHMKEPQSSASIIHRAEAYSLPSHLTAHILHVFNAVEFPYISASSRHSSHRNSPSRNLVSASSSSANPVTLNTLNERFRIPSNTGSEDLAQEVVGLNSQFSFNPLDVSTFLKLNNISVQSVRDPNYAAKSNCAGNDCQEGDFDLEYIMAIAQKTTTIYSGQSGTDSDGHSIDPILQWILNATNCLPHPQVVSISFSAPEIQVPASVKEQFNIFALKLSVQGTTIVVSSGDYGAMEWNYDTNAPMTGYYPQFPASSPYVTAVGGTRGAELGPTAMEVASYCVDTTPSMCDYFASGGGFSNFYPRPSWQNDAVKKYLGYGMAGSAAGYNVTGRAYPDIAFPGYEISFYWNGGLWTYFGTSCSAPIFAGMVSLVNSDRAKRGLPPVGFINPTLYLNAATAKYNDIVNGSNFCYNGNCYPYGFTTRKGWDPVTGWGSIDYPNLLALLGGSLALAPSVSPVAGSSLHPSQRAPSWTPSRAQSVGPTKILSPNPTAIKSAIPTTLFPTIIPTSSPSQSAIRPSVKLTSLPVTSLPSGKPLYSPSSPPTLIPLTASSAKPSSSNPTSSFLPSFKPTTTATLGPTPLSNAYVKTATPSASPSTQPTRLTTGLPSSTYSPSRSIKPSNSPSTFKSTKPSNSPTTEPSFIKAVTATTRAPSSSFSPFPSSSKPTATVRRSIVEFNPDEKADFLNAFRSSDPLTTTMKGSIKPLATEVVRLPSNPPIEPSMIGSGGEA